MNELTSPIFSWTNPKLEILRSGICGHGVFTREVILLDEICVLIGGYIINATDEPIDGDYGLQIAENFVIISSKTGKSNDLSDFINHSCNPNTGFQGQIALVAMRDIEPGEELFFDYAMCLHPSPMCTPYEMKCQCGTKQCRGVIRDHDWTNPDLQVRYDGYFQWFLQKKIDQQMLRNAKGKVANL